jgi:hypothetical protein
MMHRNNLVVAVKCNGNVLREHGEKVYLPFGSEYSILIKNLNARKALVDVDIDGREAIKGLIVHPSSETELERFFDSDMNKGYKFKFIERTKDVENFRGVRIEDGIIRVSFRYEKEIDYFVQPYRTFIPSRYNEYYGNFSGSSDNAYAVSNSIRPFNSNENGITVEGNNSNQQFSYGSIADLEEIETVITLQLFGQTRENQVIHRPVFTKDKLKCNYCGRRWKSNVQFCGNCGARLI